ncbi:WD40 repeat-like protein [Atractiella rhizophila]|nr:WD40 repeat-like protein [Atractiella rhizophila]
MSSHTPTRDALDYESPSPTFALSFSSLSSTHSNANVRLAIGSYLSSGQGDNFVTVVGLDSLVLYQLSLEDKNEDRRPLPLRNASTTSSFVPLARAQHQYPVTALEFGPPTLASSDNGVKKEMVGTTSDCLRLWEFIEDDGSGSGRNKTAPRIVQKQVLQHAKSSQLAPLTSFSWCPIDPTLIATSSVDTTCSIWDISSGTALTQLIAHDKEVFDVAWSPTQRDVFASVGADGSVRMFDLRSLEHSTILYEKGVSQTHSSKQRGSSANNNTPPVANSNVPTPSTPLLRLAYNPSNPNMLAVFHANSNSIQILDVRSPGVPNYELKAHKANVNGIAWSVPGYATGNGSLLGSCSDDSQVLLWDVSPSTASSSPPSRSKKDAGTTTQTIREPVFAYSAQCEVGSIAWSGTHASAGGSSFVAVTMGRTVRCLRI